MASSRRADRLLLRSDAHRRDDEEYESSSSSSSEGEDEEVNGADAAAAEDEGEEEEEEEAEEELVGQKKRKKRVPIITISLKRVCKVCKESGHEAGFKGATYVDCPKKPCFLCKMPGHTTLSCPHRVAMEHGVIPAPTRNTNAPFDYVFKRQLEAKVPKLDYDEILSAWSDRGPLYIEGDAPQVVPQLDGDCSEPYYAFPVMVEVGPNEAWRAPEIIGTPAGMYGRTAAEGKEKRSREERVRRYKEKRRSRLFAKRIRYEVRKQNAERRPRLKGRFVRRKGDSEDLLLSQ